MAKYIFTINDTHHGEAVFGLNDLGYIAESIAEDYLNDDPENIDHALFYGLKIELFNVDKITLGIFHVDCRYTLIVSAEIDHCLMADRGLIELTPPKD